MKGTTWEGGFREPGIIRYPPLVKPGRRFSQLASTMDIFVTALELAGVEAPRGRCDGSTMRLEFLAPPSQKIVDSSFKLLKMVPVSPNAP